MIRKLITFFMVLLMVCGTVSTAPRLYTDDKYFGDEMFMGYNPTSGIISMVVDANGTVQTTTSALASATPIWQYGKFYPPSLKFGWDGSNWRMIAVDTDGKLVVSGSGSGGSLPTGSASDRFIMYNTTGSTWEANTTTEVRAVLLPDSYESYNAWNGCIIDQPDVEFTVSGADILLSISSEVDGSDCRVVFGGTELTMESSTTTALTLGGANSVAVNFLYLQRSGSTVSIHASTTYPSGEYAWIGIVSVRTLAQFQADGGPEWFQRYTDHYSEPDARGMFSHRGERIRASGAIWRAGALVTAGVNSAASPDEITVEVTTGNIMQMHPQTFDGLSEGATIEVVNYPGEAYKEVTEIGYGSIALDSEGNSLSGKYYGIILVGLVSSNGEPDRVYAFLPSGSYGSEASALADSSGYDNVSIDAYTRQVAFYLYRIVIRHQAGSDTHSIIALQDLRGNPIGGTSPGGTGQSSEFPDSTFVIKDNVDPTKAIQFQVSGVSASTTRTYTAPDKDGTIALTSDITGGISAIGVSLEGSTIGSGSILDFYPSEGLTAEFTDFGDRVTLSIEVGWHSYTIPTALSTETEWGFSPEASLSNKIVHVKMFKSDRTEIIPGVSYSSDDDSFYVNLSSVITDEATIKWRVEGFE